MWNTSHHLFSNFPTCQGLRCALSHSLSYLVQQLRGTPVVTVQIQPHHAKVADHKPVIHLLWLCRPSFISAGLSQHNLRILNPSHLCLQRAKKIIAKTSSAMPDPALSSPNALKLSFYEKTPPVAIIAVSKLTRTSLQEYCDPKFTSASQPLLQLPNK